jgi:hypothetical protein
MPLDIGQIFPISDAPSAQLMKLKASCLFRAGILTARERAAVARKAREALSAPSATPPREPRPDSKAA